MMNVHLYETDEVLSDNIVEMLALENYVCTAYDDFDRFIKETNELLPDMAICSLETCKGITCELEPYINRISNSRIIFLSRDRERCNCCKKQISLNIPFTYEELMAVLAHD